MKTMTVLRAAQCCGGRLCGENIDEYAPLGSVIIDSRRVQPGDLFVAYRGERLDGHDYIAAALDRGAACCLAERVPEGEKRAVIVVSDVQAALEAICAEYRAELDIPVIGITGSVGKTSAKEMISAVLQRKMSVLKTEGNLNNQIGVPMTLSRIEAENEAAVVEMGISGFGEMSRLAAMARPTMAVYTVIGHAHLEFLHDLDGVMRAKGEMLDYMPEGAPIIVNGDDERLRALECKQKKILFGLSPDCDVHAENIKSVSAAATDCDIVYGSRRVHVRIPAFGEHMVYAALEGAAVGFLMGLSDEEIAEGIAAYETVGRRAAVSDTGYLTLIDDCYNANPDSMKSGVDSLLRLPGRHVCILGDMLELGEDEREMHRSVGEYAAKQGVELVLCCGKLAESIALGAGERGRWFGSRAELIAALSDIIKKGDAVLVKASHSMSFEEISEELKKLK